MDKKYQVFTKSPTTQAWIGTGIEHNKLESVEQAARLLQKAGFNVIVVEVLSEFKPDNPITNHGEMIDRVIGVLGVEFGRIVGGGGTGGNKVPRDLTDTSVTV